VNAATTMRTEPTPRAKTVSVNATMTSPMPRPPAANRLIRTTADVETPAPGRWRIPGRQQVDLIRETMFRTIVRRGRTIGGLLTVDPDGRLAVQLIAGVPGRSPVEIVRYAAASITPSADGVWMADGELTLAGAVVPQRTSIRYHGVFRHGDRAMAVLALTSRIQTARRRPHNLELRAELNAEAPAELLAWPNDHREGR
jgi:hypothetical protein